jgi:hypothetical protein
MAGQFDEKTLEAMFEKTNEKINFSPDEASRYVGIKCMYL